LQRLFVFIADKEQRDVQLLRALLPEELVLYSCEGVLPSDDILKERYGYTVVLATEEGNKLLMKNDGAELIRKITTLDTSKINNITGEIGYKGNVRGRVRRVFTTKEGQIFEFGEILVTTMTRPEWLPLMKSAAGYITDGGGILCHAAIIARELKKPCIIGTKIATQVLRDGDLVEVDADNGVVRVLERAEEKGM
jgi:phosphoenolpyruvate synthase/pyruvate phosphate dikinase